MNENTQIELSELQAQHIEKYKLNRLYKFDFNNSKLQIEIKGPGAKQKIKQIKRLISKI